MPPVVPLLRPKQVIRAFQRLGWEVVRQKGSHIILVKKDHIATLSVPNHPEVARGTLRGLIARAGTPLEEFLGAIKESGS
jgi:predicted RNA binding protein YcfA (HicA-like mRNA interferase family)